jgi:hypothetical protein
LSGVPQGSLLGPILVFMYINDIDDRIDSKILKFADDTKQYGRIARAEDAIKLQEDLALLCEWSRVGLDQYRYQVSGDTHQYRLVLVSGDTFLSIAADTGLASVGHGAVSRSDRSADRVFGRTSHATGSRRTRHISTCSIL